MDKLCDTCRFWHPSSDGGMATNTQKKEDWGQCNKAGYEDGNVDDPTTLMHAGDPYEWGGFVNVHATFGCVMHQPKD